MNIGSISVKNVEQVLQNMKNADAELQKRYEKASKKVGLFIFAEAQKLVPVEHGILKASGFVRTEGEGADIRVYIGYTASYAIYVHENLDAAHGVDYNVKWADQIREGQKKARGARQQAKWLEYTIRDERIWDRAKAIYKDTMVNG